MPGITTSHLIVFYITYNQIADISRFNAKIIVAAKRYGWVVFNNKWFEDYENAIIGTQSSINLNWTPTENISAYLELQYGTHKDALDRTGNAIRLMLTAEYSF
ncbi:MAG TPA: hypothetical protein VK994_08020 [Bacteroidales bacterium]|nr:hypothetical protein [Bacteroidales bacterium]